MSYAAIPEIDFDLEQDHDSASEVSGFSKNGSIFGDHDNYLQEGVTKLRDLADSGYISDGEEQRRKELIEQFFEYQIEVREFGDDELSSSIFVRIIWRCWRGLANLIGISPR
jgi:hypothetical protein